MAESSGLEMKKDVGSGNRGRRLFEVAQFSCSADGVVGEDVQASVPELL